MALDSEPGIFCSVVQWYGAGSVWPKDEWCPQCCRVPRQNRLPHSPAPPVAARSLIQPDATPVGVLVFRQEGEDDDESRPRAEFASCLCRRERAQIERELTAALTAQAEAEGAHAAGSESLADEAPPA
jgi:hypothetical protein